MKCIIADAGPIIALCKINQFDLVIPLFEQCFITTAVLEEVMNGNDCSVNCLQQAINLKQVRILDSKVSSNDSVSILLNTLDHGEASSILLALESKKCTLLIDEAKGREIAKKLDISVIGIAGLLILAKRKNKIGSVIPLLVEIRNQGYWLSDNFLKEIASLCEERFTSA